MNEQNNINQQNDPLEQSKRLCLIDNIKEFKEKETLELVRERLEAGDDPLKIIEDAQAGMIKVGELYEARKYYISGLMMAGEIFREVMEIVEPELKKQLSGNESGRVLLGTVKGDIHDIGKNIFGTMLTCYGFTVSDLGVDTAPERFAEEALSFRPDIIGLCGLLTSAYDAMKLITTRIRRIEDPVISCTPVIIGGGLLDASVCSYVGAEYWAIDAIVGVKLCKQIITGGDYDGKA